MALNKSKIQGVRWISDKEMDTIIDKRSRLILGISGKEFVRRRKSFQKMDELDVPGLIELLMLTGK